MAGPTLRFRRSITALLFGAALFITYLANGRPIPTLDTQPASLVPLTLVRGDGLVLDRYQAYWPQALPYSLARKRGHIVSRYPVGIPLLAFPLMAPQIAWLDAVDPGWEQERRIPLTETMAKNAAAVIVALTGVAMLAILHQLGCSRFALPAATIAALGTDLWVVASQALWQHGPAAFALALAIVLLLAPDPGPTRLFAAGVATAAIVCFRPQDLVFALPILVWVCAHHRRDTLWFLPGPIVLWSATVVYNLWYFGSPTGGYAELEAMLPVSHRVGGYWTADVLTGAVGTLLSPSRGLFVFCPWIAVALAMLPFAFARLRPWPLVWLLLLTLPVFLLQLAMFSIWWGGHSFGPRFWIDATPLFAIVLGVALEWSWEHARPLTGVLLLTGACAIGVQLLGAFCYPSTWNRSPINVDQAHERLWDWHDTELTRCWREGPKK
jgi:hypothetical protein